VLWSLSTLPAGAALITVTPTVSFSDSATATDTEGGAGTSNDGTSLGSTALDQFDATLGVLVDATINLVSTRTQSVTVAATGTGNGGKSITSTGTGRSTAQLTAPGASYTTVPVLVETGTCTGKRKETCTNTTTDAGTITNQDIAVTGSLDSYVGTGSVTVDRTASTLSATQGAGTFNGTETTQYSLSWGGDLSITYSYLLHAAPSFDGSGSVTTLTLDFGSVTRGAVVSPLDFSFFNLADGNRTGLDLDSFTLTGGSDTGALYSNLAGFSGLAQGGEQAFQAWFDTTTPGSFLEVYNLTFSDADTGAAASRSSWNLMLTISGEVVPAAAAPVPDAVWLFGSGLLGIIGIARRKSPRDPGPDADSPVR